VGVSGNLKIQKSPGIKETLMLTRILIVSVLSLMTAPAYCQIDSTSMQGNLKQPSEFAASPSATITCQSNFSSGLGFTFLGFCVTANGNILNFTAPKGFTQEFNREGYGICDASGSVVSYTDEALNDTGNWLNPTISQPNGLNTFPLSITRLTSDGIWQLKQTFSRSGSDRYVKVLMTLTNQSGSGRNVTLIRYMDVDADGSSTGDIFVAGAFSSAGLTNQNFDNHGVVLAGAPTPFTSVAFVVNAGGFDACGNGFNVNPFTGDGALLYQWQLGSIPAGGSKTVSFEYRAF
jgi:hypothetical protein